METRLLLSLATASKKYQVCARVSETATIVARTKLNRDYFIRLNAIFGYYSVCRGGLRLSSCCNILTQFAIPAIAI